MSAASEQPPAARERTLGAATVILLWLYLVARLIVAAAFLNAAVWARKHGEPA